MAGVNGVTTVTKTRKDIWAGQLRVQGPATIKSGVGAVLLGTVMALAYGLGTLIALVKSTAIAAEVLGAGDGAETDFTATLAQRPVIPGTAVVTATIGAAEVNLVEVGDGKLLGGDEDEHSGVIAYGRDGKASISLAFGTAPDNATNITLAYEHGDPDGRHLPETVLTKDEDATSAAVATQVVKLGDVRADNLIWPDGISDAHKAYCLAEMAKRGVIAL